MKKIILLIAATLLISGCWTPKRINKFKSLFCKDSTSILIKDREVKIPVNITDTATLKLLLECDSMGNIYQKERDLITGKYTDLYSNLYDNKIIIRSTVKIRDTVIKIVTDTVIRQKTVYENPRNEKIRKWDKFWAKTGKVLSVVFLIMIFGYILLRIIKSKL